MAAVERVEGGLRDVSDLIYHLSRRSNETSQPGMTNGSREAGSRVWSQVGLGPQQ